MPNEAPRGLFPSQSVSTAEKRSLEYGLKIGKAIENEWFAIDNNTDRFYGNRSHKLRLYARG